MQMPMSDAGPNSSYPGPTAYEPSTRRDGDRDRGAPPPSSRTQPQRPTHRRSLSHGPAPRSTEYEERRRGSPDIRRVRGRDIVVDDNDDPLLATPPTGRSRTHATQQDPHRASDRDREYNPSRDNGPGRPSEHGGRTRAISISSGSSFEIVRSDGTASKRQDAAGAGRRDRNRDREEGGHRASAGTTGSSRDDQSASGGGGGGGHNRASAPAAPASRTMTYASAIAGSTASSADTKTAQATATGATRAPDPSAPSHAQSARHAAAAESRLNPSESDRVTNAYPPMVPTRVGPDPRGQGHIHAHPHAAGENNQKLDHTLGSTATASGTGTGQLSAAPTHDGLPASPLPQPHHPRPPQQQQQQQAEMREQPPSATSSGGFFRSVAASVWSSGSNSSNNAPPPPRDRHKEELMRLQKEANDYREELRRADRELRSARRAHQELDHERNRLRDNAHALQHELSNVQRALDEAQALSDIRGRELVGAQVFLTKADALSISDVVEKVNVLNEEIFQAAAVFTEGLAVVTQERKKTPAQDEAALGRAYDEVASILGPVLADILHAQAQQEPRPEVHPLIAQVVLSCSLVQFCIAKLNAWYPTDSNIDQFLSTVYNQIRQNEEQAVFGRWRALLRAQIRPSTDKWTAELTVGLQKILNFSGWDAPTDVKKAFAVKLVPIFSALEDLRVAMYEKYTSADLEAFLVEAGGPFEGWMEDAYGDERQGQGPTGKEGHIVAATTGVGLKKLKTTKSSRGHSSAGVDMYESVLPPKVCLDSTLREALEPPPPTKTRKRRAPAQDEGGR